MEQIIYFRQKYLIPYNYVQIICINDSLLKIVYLGFYYLLFEAI